MQRNKFNVVTDGQWGSCGKGAITTALAHRYRPTILSTTNMANAGHTAVNIDGEKFIAKALPSATILNKWLSDYKPKVLVGPSAAFHENQLLKEYEECDQPHIEIHPRAGIICEKHIERENNNDPNAGTKHIASTMQGCGAFLSDKIMRGNDVKLAMHYERLKKFVLGYQNLNLTFSIKSGDTVLHEGSQGFSLCINHGSHYPQCTSRCTTAVQNMADMGIPPSQAGDIYLVIRPYPIRVGNVIEDGKTIGHSGGCYADQEEISWDDVAKNANMPKDVAASLYNNELTTVTKRLRRTFTFSPTQFIEAAAINGATKIALNFANYIDWSCYRANRFEQLSQKVKDWIKYVEDLSQIPVAIIGTGPQLDHVIYIE